MRANPWAAAALLATSACVGLGSSPLNLQQRIDACPIGGELVLAAGTYELDRPLRIPHALTLRAADGETVILSGGRRLKLDWQPDSAQGLYRAPLPPDLDLDNFAFDQLFLNGERLHLARYPNFDASQRYFGGTAADALSAERVASWKDPRGGIIHSLHRAEWGGNHWRILGKDAEGELEMEGGWMNNRPSGINPKHRFVENILEELDAPGEWFLDRDRRVLSLIPPADADLNRAVLVASGIERLVEVIGDSPQDPVEGVTLSGLTFAHTARTFMQTDEPLLRSDWMIHRGGAVYLENARGSKLKDCEFRALGGNGVFVSGYAEGVQVRRSHFYDLGASGVCLVGRPEAVRSPSFRYGEAVPYDQLDLTPGPKTEDYPRDCLVEDCLIHDIGVTEKQTAGVQISMAARITLRHLSIYDTPRAGINVSEGTWGGHLIEGCDVFDTVQMTGDHGSFNSWGRDRFWHPNRGTMDQLTREHPQLILLDAIETTTLRNNRWRCDHGWDIDLDDGSSNYHLINNLCLNGGIKLREGFHRRVENNVMVNNSFHPHVWFESSHDVFERNIVMDWYRPIRLNGWGDSVDHNLLPDAEALIRSHALGLDAHGAAGDPLFMDPADGDYRVAANSPAVSLGFANFAMDQFGVQDPGLRKIARTPRIPAVASRQTEPPAARVRHFLGAKVKRLQGLGERSATGIDAERGVLVLEALSGSPAHSAGLRTQDIILAIAGSVISEPQQLQTTYLQTAPDENCAVRIFRNQREHKISIPGLLAIRLDAKRAQIKGGQRAPVYDPIKDYLGSWTDAESTLSWQFPMMGAATFDVYVEIAATPSSAGATWALSLGGQGLTGTTPNTGSWEDFVRLHLGSVSLGPGEKLHARLAPVNKPGVAVMNLRAIELIRR